ncbi:hypothetical protein AGMMS4957_05290 [Bacteroidia bacterium]|nr:hypothetical protein AGMMS4957_05290 [Bacteroidia bacterium]
MGYNKSLNKLDKMKKLQLLLLSSLSIISLYAQTEKNEIDAYIQSQMESHYYVRMPDLFNDVQNHRYLSTLLEQYRNSNDKKIRGEAYVVITHLANDIKDTIYTQQLVEKFVLSQLDESDYVRNVLSKEMLRDFLNKSQFNRTAIDSLYNLFLPENQNKLSRNNILVIGFIGDINQCDTLYKYAKEKLDENHDYYFNNQFRTLKWVSKLALARMGNKQIEQECINFMKKYKSDRAFYYALCDYASYIHTEKSIDFLNELLNENILDAPLDGDEIGFPIAHRAISVLQRIILNMPDIRRLYKDQDRIEAARKWMKENKGKYKINSEIFW